MGRARRAGAAAGDVRRSVHRQQPAGVGGAVRAQSGFGADGHCAGGAGGRRTASAGVFQQPRGAAARDGGGMGRAARPVQRGRDGAYGGREGAVPSRLPGADGSGAAAWRVDAHWGVAPAGARLRRGCAVAAPGRGDYGGGDPRAGALERRGVRLAVHAVSLYRLSAGQLALRSADGLSGAGVSVRLLAGRDAVHRRSVAAGGGAAVDGRRRRPHAHEGRRGRVRRGERRGRAYAGAGLPERGGGAHGGGDSFGPHAVWTLREQAEEANRVLGEDE